MIMTKLEAAMHHLTVRRRLAKAVGMEESLNVNRTGLYAYRYEKFVMVRVYKNIAGTHTKVFEKRVPNDQFNLDNNELIAKLMLL